MIITMKCNNCGFESEADFAFCPHCGQQAAANGAPGGSPGAQSGPAYSYLAETPSYQPFGAFGAKNPVSERFFAVFKDTLFLVLCILMSASCVFQLAGEGFPLLNILITIFLWLVFAQISKGELNGKHLRSISGAVYAGYVINWVLCVLLLVGGALSFFAVILFGSSLDFLDTLIPGFSGIPLFTGAAAMFAVIILVVCLIAAAAIAAVNLLGFRQIHRFAKSVYQSIDSGTAALESVQAAAAWLMVFGVLQAITALFSILSNFTSFLGTGCCAAAAIISSLLIGKYFSGRQ